MHVSFTFQQNMKHIKLFTRKFLKWQNHILQLNTFCHEISDMPKAKRGQKQNEKQNEKKKRKKKRTSCTSSIYSRVLLVRRSRSPFAFSIRVRRSPFVDVHIRLQDCVPVTYISGIARPLCWTHKKSTGSSIMHGFCLHQVGGQSYCFILNVFIRRHEYI